MDVDAEPVLADDAAAASPCATGRTTAQIIGDIKHMDLSVLLGMIEKDPALECQMLGLDGEDWEKKLLSLAKAYTVVPTKNRKPMLKWGELKESPAPTYDSIRKGHREFQVSCKHASYVVLDVDAYKIEGSGAVQHVAHAVLSTLEYYCVDGGYPYVRTPSGGYHFYLKNDAGMTTFKINAPFSEYYERKQLVTAPFSVYHGTKPEVEGRPYTAYNFIDDDSDGRTDVVTPDKFMSLAEFMAYEPMMEQVIMEKPVTFCASMEPLAVHTFEYNGREYEVKPTLENIVDAIKLIPDTALGYNDMTPVGRSLVSYTYACGDRSHLAPIQAALIEVMERKYKSAASGKLHERWSKWCTPGTSDTLYYLLKRGFYRGKWHMGRIEPVPVEVDDAIDAFDPITYHSAVDKFPRHYGSPEAWSEAHLTLVKNIKRTTVWSTSAGFYVKHNDRGSMTFQHISRTELQAVSKLKIFEWKAGDKTERRSLWSILVDVLDEICYASIICDPLRGRADPDTNWFNVHISRRDQLSMMLKDVTPDHAALAHYQALLQRLYGDCEPFIRWFLATVVQEVKAQVAPVIWSGVKGNGKTVTFKALESLYQGTRSSAILNELSFERNSRFNSSLMEAELVVLDETTRIYGTSLQMLKGWVTGTEQMVEAKGKEATMQRAMAKFALIGNKPDTIEFEPNCRRFIPIEVTASRQPREVYDPIYNNLDEPGFKRALYDWLMECDTSVSGDSLVPSHVWHEKALHIAHSAPTTDRFLRRIVEEPMGDMYGEGLDATDLYNRFCLFHESEQADRRNLITRQAFIRYLTSYRLAELNQDTCRKRRGGGSDARWRHYVFDRSKVLARLETCFPGVEIIEDSTE